MNHKTTLKRSPNSTKANVYRKINNIIHETTRRLPKIETIKSYRKNITQK